MNDKIRTAIAQLAGTHNRDFTHVLVCTVKAIDADMRHCSATTISGNANTDIIGIQLMAEVDDGMLLIPTVGSTIIVGYSDRNTPYVLLFSQLDKVLLVVGESSTTVTTDSIVMSNNDTTVATIQSSGFSFKTANENFTQFMTDLLTVLAQQTFTNGAGTTSTSSELAMITNLQNRLPNILV